MAVFSSAPIYQPVRPAKKKPGWNIYAQRAKTRNQLRALVEENIRLRLENEQLKITMLRVQRENDHLWQEIGANNAAGGQ